MPETTPRDLPRLPDGFRFGASTAAYQIEGAVAEDGRGASVWDTFCARARPRRRRQQRRGGLRPLPPLRRGRRADARPRRSAATGSRSPGRGSSPRARGRGNPEGLAFYDRLVDELLAAGVQPMVTLFHWDLPQALEDRGGWLNRDTADRFAEYAALVGAPARRPGRALGARSTSPTWSRCSGTPSALHAPGQAADVRRAAGRAPPAARARPGGRRRCARSGRTQRRAAPTTTRRCGPPPTTPADVAAAGLYDALWNRIFADPMLLGRYPDGFAELMPGPVAASDLAVISAPLDFYGVNYYNPTRVADPASPIAADGRIALDGAPFKMVRVEGYRPHGVRLAGRPRRAARAAGRAARRRTATRCRRSTSPRAAAPTTTGRTPTARCTTRTGSPTSTRTCGRSREAVDEGVDVARLLHLVAAGQLRVGRGVHQALRPGARRLRHPAAHPEGLLRLVPRRDRRPRRAVSCR